MTVEFSFMAEQNFSIDLKAISFFFYLGFASLTPLPLTFFAYLCECGWCERIADGHSTSSVAMGEKELQLHTACLQTCASCCATAVP